MASQDTKKQHLKTTTTTKISTLVLDANGQIDRFAILCSHTDKCTCDSTPTNKEIIGTCHYHLAEIPNVVWLEDIFVKPEFRRQGHGTKLLKSISETFPRTQEVQLNVWLRQADDLHAFLKANGALVDPLGRNANDLYIPIQ